jgi:Uma2 family endonuclease
MATTKPRALIALAYEEAAQEYLRSLPPEHFMEATPQARQRKITLESLDLVSARRPDVQLFNELLVQYPRPRQRRPGQVVPDNMVVVSDQPVEAETSFNLPLEPAGPFWVLEYVSKHNKRKDYEKSFEQYERELKGPYYLVFHPEAEELTLYHHNGKKYTTVKPNKHGRHAIAELDIEFRFWMVGCASGIRASCCPCRLTCNGNWMRPIAGLTRPTTAPPRPTAGPTKRAAGRRTSSGGWSWPSRNWPASARVHSHLLTARTTGRNGAGKEQVDSISIEPIGKVMPRPRLHRSFGSSIGSRAQSG